jgi:polysaccharide export outer membrane protein
VSITRRALIALVPYLLAAAATLAAGAATAQGGAAAQSAASAQPGTGPYRVRPGDKLFISVWKEEGLAQTVIVRPDGGFTFPLAGELNANNKTTAELTNELRARLTRFIPEALVTVDVAELRGARVYIIGQVQMPGEFVMNPSLDVIQALSMAGGLNAFASPNGIRILRRGANGQTAIPFDYSQVIRGRDLEQNIVLQDGDVVIVP